MAEMDLSGNVCCFNVLCTSINIKKPNVYGQVGLKGEAMSLHSLSGSSSVEWGEPVQKQPLTWYKVM